MLIIPNSSIKKEIITPDHCYGIYRNSISHFAAKTFITCEPVDYIHNWHIDYICEYLQAVIDGNLTRLIITIPPGYMKSVLVNIAFSAYILGINPKERIISTSHSSGLTLRMSNKTRDVMKSDWYKKTFPNTILQKQIEDTQSYFKTTEKGFRQATSMLAKITGDSADLLIIDDPIDAGDVTQTSGAHIKKCNEYFDTKLYMRLRNKKTGRIIVIMQRLHQNDLVGHLLAKELGFELCAIPVIEQAKGGKLYSFGDFKYFRKEGEILFEEREDNKELDILKRTLGVNAFAGQYQQRPSPKGGGMVKIDCLIKFKTNPENYLAIVQSWDCAAKGGVANDYSVCTTWIQTIKGHYLVNVFRKKMEFPELKNTCINLAEKYDPDTIIIEDASNGQALIQELKADIISNTIAILAIKPKGDKEARMGQVTPLIESGKVFIPERAPWLIDYLTELEGFPKVEHDDQADSTSQYLNWIKSRESNGPMISEL